MRVAAVAVRGFAAALRLSRRDDGAASVGGVSAREDMGRGEGDVREALRGSFGNLC